MFGPIEAVIFDFDGTLVNTMPSVTEGIGSAIEKINGKRPEKAELLNSFGPAPQDVFRIWLPENKVDEAMNLWIDYEKNLKPESLHPFEGVEEMLRGLKERNITTALFTGRDRESAIRIMKKHGWWGTYFSEKLSVCGDDGIPTKPNPDGILHLLPLLERPASKVLMVGDHPHDMRAAKAAKVKSAAALWDLPGTEKTHRANFKRIWDSWNSHDIDVRLVQPGSLLEWVRSL